MDACGARPDPPLLACGRAALRDAGLEIDPPQGLLHSQRLPRPKGGRDPRRPHAPDGFGA